MMVLAAIGAATGLAVLLNLSSLLACIVVGTVGKPVASRHKIICSDQPVCSTSLPSVLYPGRCQS